MKVENVKKILNEGKNFPRFQFWITPKNLEEQRERFLRGEIKNPQFIYPLAPKREIVKYLSLLENIESVEGETLEKYVYERKIIEKKLKLNLVLKRNEGLTEISREIYKCNFKKDDLENAEIDSKLPGVFASNKSLLVSEVVRGFREYLNSYNAKDWQVKISSKKDFYIKVRSEKKTVFVSEGITSDFSTLDSLLSHEVDGHVLRSINSQNNEGVLKKPLPFRIKTEEGLACYLSDYYSDEYSNLSLKHHALKYLAGYMSMSESFKNVFDFLVDNNFSKELAFQRTFRLKRGLTDTSQSGLYAREAVYYEGMLEVKKYVDENGDLEKLFGYKCGLEDIKYLPSPAKVILPRRLKRH